MVQAVELEVLKREESKTSKAKKLRRKNLIPGVVYGPETEPLMISVDKTKVDSLLARVSETTRIKLLVKSNDGVIQKNVFVKEIQRNKVNDSVIHIDFYEPAKGHTMHIHIPLHFVGKPKGVEKGGLEDIIHHELPVEVLPDKIVEHIEVDVSQVDLGESLRVKDIQLPEGIKVTLDPEEVIMTIIAPRVSEEVVEEVTEEEEPEVIGKGKEEEEEE
jgi:large subunit ribosomal protein L25